MKGNVTFDRSQMTGWQYMRISIPKSLFRKFYIVLIFGSTSLLCLIFFVIRQSSLHSNSLDLSDSILGKSHVKDGLPDESIFFMETTGKCQINPRQACSVESAAHHHPNRKIILYTVCKEPELLQKGALNPLKNNTNIVVKALDLELFFKGTVLESWYASHRWEYSSFVTNHLSDALRFLMLWKHGGIYLDLDVIVLRPLTSLYNCFGLQDKELANGAVMIFEAFHPFIAACMVEYAKTYDPSKWGYNGPELITRISRKHCGWTSISQWTRSSCLNATLVPVDFFYAIPWETPEELFEVDRTESTMTKLEQSYAIHLWNKYSKVLKVILGSGSAMDIITRKNCPIIYSHNIPNGEI